MATITSLNYYGFAWNGFAFGGANSPYQITSADGIEGLPVIRNQDDTQGFNDGMFSGRDFLSGRTITLTILTLSNNTTATITAATAGATAITYTTSAYHGFNTGQTVTVTGILSTGNPTGTAGAGFNRNAQTLTVLNNTQFTIPVAITDTYTSGGSSNVTMSAQANYNLLKQNLLPTQGYTTFSNTNQLQFQLSAASGLQFFNARVRDSKTVITPDFTYGYITSQWTFYCPDPRFYDNTQLATTINYSTLGRTYNRIYPLLYGGGSIAPSAAVNNIGWATTYPTITITGPITNPTIGSTTQNQYITIQGTYASTDTIIVNLAQRLVTINGSPARNLVVGGSNWFSAQPGSNSFYLTGSGYTLGVTAATVAWYNAYI